jgi:vacuolar-type H+-ATPase subunit H
VSVEDIRDLLEQEKESEKELREAKEKAERILKEAKAEAKRISEQADDDRYYEALIQATVKKASERKATMEQEFENTLEKLQQTASMNMDKAVAFIVKQVLEGWST